MDERLENRVLTAMRLAQIVKDSSDNGERFCFVLGAGASKESGIKTGVEMAREWGKYIEDYQDDFGNAAIDALKKKLQLDNLTQADSSHYFGLYDFRWNGEPQNGYHYIQSHIENVTPSYGYYPLAMQLAKTKNNLVITTNFDNLAEDALTASTDIRPIVIGHESLTAYVDLNQSRPIIAKLHRGLFLKPFSSQEDTGNLKDGWEGALTKAFGIYIPLVIGYAGGDHSLMDYLKATATTLRGFYWCYRKGDEPSEEIQQMVLEKNGFFVEINGFDSVMCLIGNKFEYKSPSIEIRDRMTKRAQTLTKNYEERYRQLMDELEAAPLTNYEASTAINVLKSESEKQKEALDEIIAKNPKDADAYNDRGEFYWREGDYERAVADYTKAIELSPEDDMFYYNRAYGYDSLGEHRLAIDDFDKSIQLDPHSAFSYYSRSMSHLKLGNHHDALNDATEAINLMPTKAILYRGRAQVYEALAQPEKASADLAKSDELDSKKMNS